MITLENGLLKASFVQKGAELQSLKSKTSGIEYIWDANPKDWAKHSPVLFPIVGALKDNRYAYQGEQYELSRHGFARDMEFELESKSADEVVFTLRSSESTKKVYPFEFSLSLIYTLKSHGLSCTYKVYNPSDADLLFSVGGHPAFATPVDENLRYEDYYLRFNQDEELLINKISDNLISEEVKSIPLKDKVLSLKYDLFYEDALVIKALKSNKISLQNKVNSHGLHFSFEGFPYFGIWAAEDANFVCLEPWCGIADSVNHSGQLSDKEGIVILSAEESWQRTWQVDIF
ncbi:aldose 1-epimerase family protein [Pedobacter sp. SAFR-022]|uniref:aldose 1-epimerase family protein n=1 Tax=Pedobacter sp. SAFR-022 TaxID=3436861 RepID=UPI003F7F897A